jgi:hypothetical protein
VTFLREAPGRSPGPAPAGALLAAAATAVLAAGCGGGGEQRSYTERSIQRGFVTAADIGKGAISFRDPEHGTHIVYTPPESVPTCPYVQRADDVSGRVDAAVQLEGGNATGRFIVGPPNPERSPLPVVTQGAVVFKTEALAAAGMKTVTTAASKCPSAFTILGGPPIVVGHYTVNRRPVELAGWKGFAQQLAHTSPRTINPETYDDLVTVVLRKANAILYAGFAQIKRIGQRADSGAKAEAVMKDTLKRLG